MRGVHDIFVAKLYSGGMFAWAISAGGNSNEYSLSIAIDGSGNSYLTGHFLGKTSLGATTLISKGRWDIFVAKLDKKGKF